MDSIKTLYGGSADFFRRHFASKRLYYRIALGRPYEVV
jgi:hypothetical protein